MTAGNEGLSARIARATEIVEDPSLPSLPSVKISLSFFFVFTCALFVGMKTILCFGDSNTWGYRPDGMGRFEWEVRWPGILQKEVSGFARVIEEGLNARTTVI